ncbi:proline iminopeptidase-family hydrolase [Aquimarina sp. 2201CG5-10]|uniref:proline iminopeptidase-family hydrolase n=1 Tax=Aquimarina callyspongiae TaxID=3098150 RepID=UPI002AB339AD|nr:proline iminopeptidase-family hydrolase [Aquimarina sp. 2201CG5-10]MDY8137320.1 proline iminopeptidase-family hydrolase [Aquimarina sp. 2201CG5-10]
MKTKVYLLVLFITILLPSCNDSETTEKKGTIPVQEETNYFDYTNHDDQFMGGIKMIPISTPKGEFKVWTKRVGNNPKIKVLLLHGGPGMTHEIYECFDGYFPQEGIEYYYYDQLGSYYSDQPKDKSLWDLDRFVEEVEQVRIALGLNKDNFYLYGQSWGGILGMQYALKYQNNLKGLIISNMVASIPEYQKYSDEVLAPQLDPEVLKEIMSYEEKEEYSNERYLDLIVQHYYTKHIIRMPVDQWPDPINRGFKHLNPDVYVTMQGPSEFGIKGDATLKNWDVKDQLSKITVPTLSIGAKYDTMDPKEMEWIANEVQNGRYLHCPNGSHLSQFDDQKNFFTGLIKFIKDVDNGDFEIK